MPIALALHASLLLITAPVASAPAKTPSPVRIELYTEINRGNSRSGEDKHVGSDGKVYGMGRADYRPVVQRCELVLDDAARVSLRQQTLTYLPYFRDQKPEVTLGAFVDAGPEGRRQLLPPSLEGYLKHSDEQRRSFATLVEPDGSSVNHVVVVWLGARLWYVDDMFYRFTSFDPLRLPRGACDDVLEGSLADFLRDSPLVAPRRTEGTSALRHPALPYPKAVDTPVLQLQLSPGMPNSFSYSLTVLADGSYNFNGSRSAAMSVFEPHRLTALFKKARAAGLHRSELVTTPHAPSPTPHDGQTTTLRLYVDDVPTTYTIDATTPPNVLDFVAAVKQAYGIGDGTSGPPGPAPLR